MGHSFENPNQVASSQEEFDKAMDMDTVGKQTELGAAAFTAEQEGRKCLSGRLGAASLALEASRGLLSKVAADRADAADALRRALKLYDESEEANKAEKYREDL